MSLVATLKTSILSTNGPPLGTHSSMTVTNFYTHTPHLNLLLLYILHTNHSFFFPLPICPLNGNAFMNSHIIPFRPI